MGRPSLRAERRRRIAHAYGRVLGQHGQAGATIAAVAAEAGVAPGLVHHYFAGKQDLVEALLEDLLAGFRERLSAGGDDGSLTAYVDAALALGTRSDVVSARAWVGLFAEAMSDATIFRKLRRALDGQIALVNRRGRGKLTEHESAAVLAFIVGALVFGAFAPQKTAGFAAPTLRRWIELLGADHGDLPDDAPPDDARSRSGLGARR